MYELQLCQVYLFMRITDSIQYSVYNIYTLCKKDRPGYTCTHLFVAIVINTETHAGLAGYKKVRDQ